MPHLSRYSSHDESSDYINTYMCDRDDITFDSGISSENLSPYSFDGYTQSTTPNYHTDTSGDATVSMRYNSENSFQKHFPEKVSENNFNMMLSLNPLMANVQPRFHSEPPRCNSSSILPSYLVTEEATLGDGILTSSKNDSFNQIKSVLQAVLREQKIDPVNYLPEPIREKKVDSLNYGPQSKGLVPKRGIKRTQKSMSPKRVTKMTNEGHINKKQMLSKPASLYNSYPPKSKDGKLELRIISQPEEQHRARYKTEGSRGAVKDRKGTNYPIVQLFGYSEPLGLQIFIGNDQGKPQPHISYQASRVCGKYSNPCLQKIIDGTVVLELEMHPQEKMTVNCDCVGILKERNVEVNQRLDQYGGSRNKKRSPKCRMVFRVAVPKPDGSEEVLQIASAPILCTQPPGIPEICKKSHDSCSAQGNIELFIIGKNFGKDTSVVFRDSEESNYIGSLSKPWEEEAFPEKEFLHQTHLVCKVPPYREQSISRPVTVELIISSSGRFSEPHLFSYLPTNSKTDVLQEINAAQKNVNPTMPIKLSPPYVPSPPESVAGDMPTTEKVNDMAIMTAPPVTDQAIEMALPSPLSFSAPIDAEAFTNPPAVTLDIGNNVSTFCEMPESELLRMIKLSAFDNV